MDYYVVAQNRPDRRCNSLAAIDNTRPQLLFMRMKIMLMFQKARRAKDLALATARPMFCFSPCSGCRGEDCQQMLESELHKPLHYTGLGAVLCSFR